MKKSDIGECKEAYRTAREDFLGVVNFLERTLDYRRGSAHAQVIEASEALIERGRCTPEQIYALAGECNRWADKGFLEEGIGLWLTAAALVDSTENPENLNQLVRVSKKASNPDYKPNELREAVWAVYDPMTFFWKGKSDGQFLQERLDSAFARYCETTG